MQVSCKMHHTQLTPPYAWGKPKATAQLKTQTEDFIVEEELVFSPTGIGEHVFLFIEKQEQNTAWVARQIAIETGISKSKISYAGLKDRHGITRQWFSIHAPGKKPAEVFASEIRNIPGSTVLRTLRHTKKLQRGALKGNRFTIRLRQHEGDKKETESRLHLLAEKGVPNYFGHQRFGHHNNNIPAALAMFREERKVGRAERSILLSAARSLIFNAILAERVKNNTWNQYQPDDVLTFRSSQSLIFPDKQDESIPERFQKQELLLTAPLWGKGEISSTHAVKKLEIHIASLSPELCQGLEEAGMHQERRAIQLLPNNLEWQWDSDDLLLQFSLRKGSYATTLLREAVNYTDISLTD